MTSVGVSRWNCDVVAELTERVVPQHLPPPPTIAHVVVVAGGGSVTRPPIALGDVGETRLKRSIAELPDQIAAPAEGAPSGRKRARMRSAAGNGHECREPNDVDCGSLLRHGPIAKLTVAIEPPAR
jgi:hypothetical protein